MTTKRALKVFWITPKWPFPVTDGARIATTELLRCLAAQGMNICLGSIVPEDETIDPELAKRELGVTSVKLIRKKKVNRLRLFFHFLKRPFFPIVLAPYATSQVLNELVIHCHSSDFDLIVYDGLHAASARLARKDIHLPCAEAYRAHNVEGDIWFRAARETRNPLKKALLSFQGELISRAEGQLVQYAQFVFPVSRDDEMKLKKDKNSLKFRTLPIGMKIQALAKTSDSAVLSQRSDIQKKILFVGKLDWAPNRDGLKWLLKNVWPQVTKQDKNISLNVVGSGESGWIQVFRGTRGLNIIGPVESLASFYQDCIATVVPVFYGSGTRVKAIESCLYGRACISTQMGVEGMGLTSGENYYGAETAEEWIRTLSSLQSKKALAMGRRAQEHSMKTFDSVAIADQFIKTVSGE